jgi:uncharacterized protein (DUF433 family)
VSKSESRRQLRPAAASRSAHRTALKAKAATPPAQTSQGYDFSLSVLFKKAARQYSQISIDPGRHVGAPCITGTRIPVYMVLDVLREHGSIEKVREYPSLTLKQIRDAVGFAKYVVECPIDEVAPAAR